MPSVMSMLGRQSDDAVGGKGKDPKTSPNPSVGTQSSNLFYLGWKRSVLGKYPELAIRMNGWGICKIYERRSLSDIQAGTFDAHLLCTSQ